MDVLQFGAMWEDDKPPAYGDKLRMRPLNHFFDPQNNRALTIETGFQIGSEYPVLFGPGGHRSPDWILEDNTDIDPSFGPLEGHPFGQQEFSYFDARNYFFDSLVSRVASDRKVNITRMYQSLGHVLHHIQDMGQPQHVRNDMHCDACPVNDISEYEELTGNEGNMQRIEQRGLLDRTQYSLDRVVLDFPRQYWVSNGWGMADYTSHNFVTTESNYLSKASNAPLSPSDVLSSIQTNSKYPFPNTANLVVSSPVLLRDIINGALLPVDNKDLLNSLAGNSRVYFLGKNLTDNYPNKRPGYLLYNSRHATFGFFSHYYYQVGDQTVYTGVFTEGRPNYESRLQFLFPRITAFSSGMLDYFFRGSIGLYQQNGRWFVRNTTSIGNDRSMDGEFLIMAQNRSGERIEIARQQGTLAPGASTPGFDFIVPHDNAALVAVFKGRLGQEGNGNRLFAVAGAYVPFETPPPVRCNTPLSPAGGVGTWNFPISLGGTKGDVDLDFETYTVPDSLRITLDDGRELYSTGGLVSGYRRRTVSFDPNGRVDVIATAKITAPTNGTAWTFRLGCPGVPLSDDRIAVTYYWGPTSGAQCRVRVKVDGTTYTSSTLSTSHQFSMKLKPGTHSYDVVNYDCTRVDLGTDFTFRVKVGSKTTTLKDRYGGAWTGNISVGNVPSIPGATNW